MQNLGIVGPELDRANVSRRRARHLEDEVAEDFTFAGLQHVRLGALHHHIRRSQLPAFWKRGRLRRLRSITFGCSLLDPLLKECDLIVAQAARVEELPVARLGKPRRHRARQRRCGDLAGTRAGALVVEQAEGRSGNTQHIATFDARTVVNRAMAGCAVFEKDRRDVFVERNGSGDSGFGIRGSGFGIRGALRRALTGND